MVDLRFNTLGKAEQENLPKSKQQIQQSSSFKIRYRFFQFDADFLRFGSRLFYQ